MEKRKCIIKICGKEYTLVGTENQDYLTKIGDYINDKMLRVMRSNNELTIEASAILTAINVADDYFKQIDTADGLRKQIAEYINKDANTEAGDSFEIDEIEELSQGDGADSTSDVASKPEVQAGAGQSKTAKDAK
ncbi:MAG: cell division protein ZapA [Clostridiales bacterium]|nr:cell division protein ZapA [Clostridiales bacterium]